MYNIFSFTKIEHTFFSLPLVFVGAWFGMGGACPDLMSISLIILATIGARIFGMSFNRIFDRKIDALNPRTADRELPSQKMTVRNALFIACFGMFIYILSCAALGGLCFWLSPIPIVPLLLYSLLKRFTYLCHFGIGFCLALAPLSAFIATSGNAKFTFPVILFSIFVFCWLSGTDIIYSLMDIESDRSNEIHSLPANFGIERANQVAVCLHTVSLIIIGIIIFLLGGTVLSWFFFFISLVFFFLVHLPLISLEVRFFPLSSCASIAGSVSLILA